MELLSEFQRRVLTIQLFRYSSTIVSFARTTVSNIIRQIKFQTIPFVRIIMHFTCFFYL